MSATISLIALRFEIASVTNNASFLNFSAQQYKEQKTTTDSTFTYASVLSSEDRKKEDIDVIRECRGSRKHQEFIVESYYNECLGRETDVDNPENMPNKHKAKKTSEKSAPPEERYVLSKDKQIAGGDDFHPISPSPAPVHRPKSIIDEPGPSPSPAVGQEDSQKRLSGSSGRHKSQSPSLPPNIHFYYGNPMVERIEGILHLYKENKMTPLKGDQPRSELICMLAVPGMYSIHDLLKFTAPVNEAVEYMRIIRDGTPNQFMALIKFKSQESADEFYCTYNNVQFNSIEPDICSLAYVAKVETEKETEGANLPVPGFTELPCCPVCLEKMDESVEGVLTILCNHSFHMSCLSKWGDTSCPVCRYIQTPEDVSESRCMKCGSSESLWICLICGHIGCGRYVELHAYRHFQDTNHMYAMQLGQNRVWDYVGDNYVHRLVQSKGDGKLVQVGENQSEGQEEKIDSLNLEYTYLLTSQLESQRHYFEEKVKLVEQAAQEKVDEILSKNEDKVQEMSSICERLESVIKEKSQLEKKCAHLHSRLTKALTELQEEKDINACMRKNQESWQKKTDLLIEYNDKLRSDKNKEIEDLREQVRDVMFYLEAAKQLSNNTEVSQAEIQESQVVLGATGSTPSPSHRRGKKKEK